MGEENEPKEIEQLIEKLDEGIEKIGGDLWMREYAWYVDGDGDYWLPYTDEEAKVISGWRVAIDELVRIGEPAVKRLSEVATDRNCRYEKRRHAIEALGQIKSERAAKVLISLRDNECESKKLREWAVAALRSKGL